MNKIDLKIKEFNLKEAKDGHEVEVGDFIRTTSAYGDSLRIVRRKTKKYVFVKNNEVSEGKFPVIYGWGFESLPRVTWRTTDYKVYIKPTK